MQMTKEIIGLIIGFPIACCGILMYYIKYTRDKETKKLKEALDTSTFAIVQCIDDLRDHLAKGDKKLKEALDTSTFAIVNCFDDLRNHLTKGDNNADQ